MLTAKDVNSQDGPPSKYIFNADERDTRGLVRHDVLTWRNGNQLTSAVAGHGISASEIRTIRTAMRGIPIRGVRPSKASGPITEYRIP